MSKTVVAGLRTGPILSLIAAGVAIGAYVAVVGLSNTQLFRVLGIAIYPFFYGALAIAIWQSARMLARRNDYISVDGQLISVGRTTVRADEISGVCLRPGLATELVLQRRNGSDVVVKSWMLSKPASEVQAHLQSILRKGAN